jgi:hypothetical protein
VDTFVVSYMRGDAKNTRQERQHLWLHVSLAKRMRSPRRERAYDVAIDDETTADA